MDTMVVVIVTEDMELVIGVVPVVAHPLSRLEPGVLPKLRGLGPVNIITITKMVQLHTFMVDQVIAHRAIHAVVVMEVVPAPV